MYLLDTNTLIYFFKGLGNVSQHLFLQEPKKIFIPSIVVYELEVGIAKSNDPAKRIKQLDHLLEQTNTLEFALKEAKASASIRAELEKAGTPIGPMDTLIAGIARAHNLTLITRNTKEFNRISGLNLENWY